jgi:Uma2 family endonuclease
MTALLPAKHLFNVDEWDRLGELGFFGEDDRVELVEGEIVDMSPIGDWHASCVNRLNRIFGRAVGDAAIVQVQGPVRLSRHSEPLPDIALLKYRPDFYASAKPGPEDLLLLIEVSDTTASYDLGSKAQLYSRHGVPEYWVVDQASRCVHVCLGPGPEGFSEARAAGVGAVLTPQLLPAMSVEVALLFAERWP